MKRVLLTVALALASTVVFSQTFTQRMLKAQPQSRAKDACIVPAPSISLSPASIAFPSTTSGMTSGPQPLTIINTGNAPLYVSQITFSPPGDPDPFYSSSCDDTTIAPGDSCVASVFFDANGSPGARSQSLRVNSNAPGSPHVISVTGTVASSGPVPMYSRSPAGPVFVGSAYPAATSTPPANVTISNPGSGPLLLSFGAVPAPFALASNTCPGSLPASGSCTLSFQMVGSAIPGNESGSLSVTHNGAGGMDIIPLQGTTLDPNAAVSFDPPDFYFGSISSGGTAGGATILTNSGASPLTIGTVTMQSGAHFAITSETCSGQVLAPMASCNIAFDFTAPGTAGYIDDNVVVTSDAPGGDAYLYVYGYSVTPPPSLTFVPAMHDFGTQLVGNQVCTTVTMTNNDMPGSPTSFSYAIYDANYFLDSETCQTTCGTDQQGGTSCTLGVYFQPTAVGSLPSYVEIYEGNSQQYYYVDLAGVGSGPVISLDQYYVDFGSHPAGSTSPSRTLTATNTGDTPLTISSIAMLGMPTPFTVVSETCTAGAIPPAGTCIVEATFSPPGEVNAFDYLIITSNAVNASGGITEAEFYGTGTTVAVGSTDYFPETVEFGTVVLPNSSAPRSVSFANNGSAPLTIDAITGPFDVALTHDCPLAPSTLAPGVCCSITGTFSPTVIGIIEGNIQVSVDSGRIVDYIPVYGEGVPPPSFTPTPGLMSFVAVVGTRPPPQDILLTNTGITNGVTFTGASIGGEFFLYDPDEEGEALAAPADAKRKFVVPRGGKRAKAIDPFPHCFSTEFVNRGEKCYFTVWWRPSFIGTHSTNLVVNFVNGAGNPLIVPVVGRSLPETAPGIALSTSTLTVPGVINRDSDPAAVVVTNTGTAPLSLFAATARPPFRVESRCPDSLAPGASCTLNVIYHATIIGRELGDLFIEHGAGGDGFLQVKLIGEGQPIPQPKISVSVGSVSFGPRVLGSTVNATSRIVVRNVGNAPLEIGGVTAAPGFTLANGCLGTVAPNRECTLDVGFKPSGVGKNIGTVSITSNDPDRGVATVSLEGTGCRILSVAASRSGARACGP